MELTFTEEEAINFLIKFEEIRKESTSIAANLRHDLMSGTGAIGRYLINVQNHPDYDKLDQIDLLLEKYNDALKSGMKGIGVSEVANSPEQISERGIKLHEALSKVVNIAKTIDLDQHPRVKRNLTNIIYSSNSNIGTHSEEYYILKKDLRRYSFQSGVNLYLGMDDTKFTTDYLPILIGLISNTFTHSQTEEQLIPIFGELLEGNFLITYQDSGIGIPPENLESIFQKGFTTRKEKEGHGLGLYSARQFMEKNGGSIIALPYDEGARFEITIPEKHILE